LDAALSAAEPTAGLAAGSLRIAALVETAVGLLEAPTLGVSSRLSHLAIGEADLAADLGMPPPADAAGLVPLRVQVVVASAACRLAPPTGPVDTDVRDLTALAESSRALRRLGFGSRSAIHPTQVPVIEEAFTPTAVEVARARELLAEHDGSTGVDRDGRFVDEAVLRSARRVVAVADRLRL
jgi:citrate lyase subunit beta/citryl-CoA lyase